MVPTITKLIIGGKMKMKNMANFLLNIWQMPQLLLAKCLVKNSKPSHSVDGVGIYYTSKIEGLSCGDVILYNKSVPEGTWLIKHEFGHIIQSRILGWLYLPVIFLPSYLWYSYVSKKEKKKGIEWSYKVYYKFYTESWANRLVGIQPK